MAADGWAVAESSSQIRLAPATSARCMGRVAAAYMAIFPATLATATCPITVLSCGRNRVVILICPKSGRGDAFYGCGLWLGKALFSGAFRGC
jgi:hypothetical protein